MRRRHVACAIACLLLAAPLRAAPPTEAIPAEGDAKESARVHFEEGKRLLDRGLTDAALAEFLLSREKFPTRGNTYNAALALRKLGRLDEALDLFKAFLREFPPSNDEEKRSVEREVVELEALMGEVEITATLRGATVTIDDRPRGTTPLAGPVRVSAGTHVLRVTAPDALPYEQRFEIIGKAHLRIAAELRPLGENGKLSVREEHNGSFEVVVDGTVVGKTPYEGRMPIGDHTVLLRGDAHMGSEPALASIRTHQVTALVLAAEKLDSKVMLLPTPKSARLFVDGVPVGSGTWEGRLRPGAHTFEADAPGYFRSKRESTLPAATLRVSLPLERDPRSPYWPPSQRAKAFGEIDLGPSLGLFTGGAPNAGCNGACSRAIPVGAHGMVRGGYEFSSGIGLGVELGAMHLPQHVERRPDVVTPVGKPELGGFSNDVIKLNTLMLGGSAGFRFGTTRFPILARLGIGALLGGASDRRNGSFDAPEGSTPAQAARTSTGVVYVYVAPEIRAGVTLTNHLSLFLGVRASFLFGKGATWDASQATLAGSRGMAYWRPGDFLGGTVGVLQPSLSLRYEF